MSRGGLRLVHPAPKKARGLTAYELARSLEDHLTIGMPLGRVPFWEVAASMLELWSYDETDAIECRHLREAARLVRLRFGVRS